jgi:hypothetical protein
MEICTLRKADLSKCKKAALVLVAPITVKSATASEVCAAKIQLPSFG